MEQRGIYNQGHHHRPRRPQHHLAKSFCGICRLLYHNNNHGYGQIVGLAFRITLDARASAVDGMLTVPRSFLFFHGHPCSQPFEGANVSRGANKVSVLRLFLSWSVKILPKSKISAKADHLHRLLWTCMSFSSYAHQRRVLP